MDYRAHRLTSITISWLEYLLLTELKQPIISFSFVLEANHASTSLPFDTLNTSTIISPDRPLLVSYVEEEGDWEPGGPNSSPHARRLPARVSNCFLKCSQRYVRVSVLSFLTIACPRFIYFCPRLGTWDEALKLAGERPIFTQDNERNK